MEIRNKFDREISFDNLQDAKQYFFPKTEKPCEPEEYLGENYENYCKAFQAYKVEIKAARDIEELADVLNRYSDVYGNGTEYYIKRVEVSPQTEPIEHQGICKGSKVKVHMYDLTRPPEKPEEIKTKHYGEIFEVKEQNGKLGIDWNTERSPYTCHGEVFTPFDTFASSVVFEDIDTGKTYSQSNITNTLEEANFPTPTDRKYELTDIRQSVSLSGETLYRIRALKDFTNEATGLHIQAGQLGGYVQSEANLSQRGTCWIDDNARVFNKATVSGNAYVADDAMVNLNAMVKDNATVTGSAWIAKNATISGNAYITEMALISGNATVTGNATVCGTYTAKGNITLSEGTYGSDELIEEINIEPVGGSSPTLEPM